jgi:hypothetical protein
LSATTPQSRTLRAWQGLQRDYQALQIVQNDGTPAVGIFTAQTTLQAVVWEGADQTPLFNPVVAWNNGGTGWATGQFQCSFLPTPTSALDPAGEYHFLLETTTAGVTSPVWEGLLKILASPGSSTLAPPDLITYDYCLGMLSGLALSDNQIDSLPGIISSASNLLRQKCNDRYFDLRTLTETHEVSLDGYVRLWQEPIQIITRVQGQPNLALTVFNNSSSVQTAQAYFAFTGFDGGVNSNAKTATGIILNWVSNGTPNTQTLLFSANPTIGQIATAINAVGSGWTAQPTGSFSSWVCTELTGGFIAQGCTQLSFPNAGARFNVLTDLDHCKLRPRTPMLYVGTQRGGNVTAEQWGPGGHELWGDGGDYQLGEVKVTYQAGFNVIPSDVQNATVQLVKYMLELLKQELLLKSESAAEYKYELAPEMVSAMPKPVWEMIGNRKFHYA